MLGLPKKCNDLLIFLNVAKSRTRESKPRHSQTPTVQSFKKFSMNGARKLLMLTNRFNKADATLNQNTQRKFHALW